MIEIIEIGIEIETEVGTIVTETEIIATEIEIEDIVTETEDTVTEETGITESETEDMVAGIVVMEETVDKEEEQDILRESMEQKKIV
eukprot:CAMPEP_0184048256 /NCGR_PEP_ID=MMETSP0956-20121227/2664_1 /TAXON_ID=627963 /ORGANISM="Aplanochytrium sp, Strain PBS07" /LENGTH=86 /DNA_ID=CAMNT_0026340237 /DNA_START=105 /DNA_END=365 /DNA_ORIENTATION=-